MLMNTHEMVLYYTCTHQHSILLPYFICFRGVGNMSSCGKFTLAHRTAPDDLKLYLEPFFSEARALTALPQCCLHLIAENYHLPDNSAISLYIKKNLKMAFVVTNGLATQFFLQ